MFGDTYLAIPADIDGRRLELHYGGVDNGYFCEPNGGARVRAATPEEIEAGKRFFWQTAE